MLSLRTLLCAFDDSVPSAQALVAAADLAERVHATLHIVQVDPLFHAPKSHADGTNLNALYRSRMQVAVDRLLGEGAFDVLAPVLHVLQSEAPADGILRCAAEVGADLVVLGTHRRRGLERLLAGSVAAEVLRRSSVPVLVASARTVPGPEAPVVAAVDLEDPSLRALEVARDVAAVFGASLQLATVRAVTPDTLVGTGPHRKRLAPSPEKVSREAAHAALGTVAEAVSVVGAETHVLPGVPVPDLVHLAERTRAGLLVVGTHGRHGWDRLRLGSVAEGVVTEAPCSVLVVPLAVRSAAMAPEGIVALHED